MWLIQFNLVPSATRSSAGEKNATKMKPPNSSSFPSSVIPIPSEDQKALKSNSPNLKPRAEC